MDDLDCIEVTSPCQVAWDGMAGDDRVRHCGQCRQNVYNIAAMTRPEAVRLISQRQGGLCLRIFRRPDGTVVTADCRSRLHAARRKGMWPFLAMLLVVGWAEVSAMFVGLQGLRRLNRGRTGYGDTSEPDGLRTMGLLRVRLVDPPLRPTTPPPPDQDVGILGGIAPPSEWQNPPSLAHRPRHRHRRSK